jgi:hypothetical protein
MSGIPVPDFDRPVEAVLELAAAAIRAAGIKAQVYTGSSWKRLEDTIGTALVQGDSKPVAIVCYAGSEYANDPRRVLLMNIVVVSLHTRVAPGVMNALDAARAITGALDEKVTTEEEADGWTVRDVWHVESEDFLDLTKLNAAAAVMLAVTVEDR